VAKENQKYCRLKICEEGSEVVIEIREVILEYPASFFLQKELEIGYANLKSERLSLGKSFPAGGS
jgi:hypothetical protein